MAFKPRCESEELKILRILNTRMDLSAEDKKNYFKLEKGYQGEVLFDSMTEKLQNPGHILNDLLLKVNNTTFQIDSTIIYQEKIYLFEVKNYEGDYCYDPEKFETITGYEVANPLPQLKRCASLYRQLLQNLGFNIPIEAYVVFVNPRFTLYKAPPNEPFIFPTQLDALMSKLNKQPAKLSNWHKKLADKLVSLHHVESPYPRLPPYDFSKLRKGITSKGCNSFKISVCSGEKKLVCGDCGCEEEFETAVLRSVMEIKLLFPDRKITTNCVHEWCGEIGSKKKINRILTKKYKRVGHGKFSYYVEV